MDNQKQYSLLVEAFNAVYDNISESHFKVGDEVICKKSGMEGEVIKLDKPDGKEDEKYYTVKREDGKKIKYSPNELKLAEEVKNGGAPKKSETKFHTKLDKLVHSTFGSSPEEKKKEMKEETDLFDYILEHLVAEGYADTNENALVIMANMSEEWRQSIINESLLDVVRGVGKVAGNVAKDVKDRVTGKKELIGGPQGYVKVGGPSKPGDVKVSGIGPVGTYGKRTTPTGTNSPAATMSMRAR